MRVGELNQGQGHKHCKYIHQPVSLLSATEAATAVLLAIEVRLVSTRIKLILLHCGGIAD